MRRATGSSNETNEQKPTTSSRRARGSSNNNRNSLAVTALSLLPAASATSGAEITVSHQLTGLAVFLMGVVVGASFVVLFVVVLFRVDLIWWAPMATAIRIQDARRSALDGQWQDAQDAIAPAVNARPATNLVAVQPRLQETEQ